MIGHHGSLIHHNNRFMRSWSEWVHLIHVKTLMCKPVLYLHLIIYRFIKIPLCLVSAENNNNKHYCLKSLRKNLLWLQELLHVHTCIGSWENGNCYPPQQDVVYTCTSPHGWHQKFQGEGGPRGGNFQGAGATFLEVFFSGDFETRIIVFIDDLTLTVSWLVLSQLTSIVYVMWMSSAHE